MDVHMTENMLASWDLKLCHKAEKVFLDFLWWVNINGTRTM